MQSPLGKRAYFMQPPYSHAKRRSSLRSLLLGMGVLAIITGPIQPLGAQEIPDSRTLWRQGESAQIAGQWNTAIAAFSSLLQLRPNDADTMVALGYSHYKLGALDEAEKLYRQALSINNRHVGAGYGLGQIAIGRQQWNEATGFFRDVMRIAPTYEPVRTRHNLALSLHALKRYNEAAAVYEEASATTTKDHYPELYRNAIDNEIAREEYRQAVRWGEQGTQLFPSSAWLWNDLGWAWLMRREPERSRSAYNRAEALVYPTPEPRHRTILSLPFRGKWLVAQGNNGAATHRGLGSRFAWDFRAINDKPAPESKAAPAAPLVTHSSPDAPPAGAPPAGAPPAGAPPAGAPPAGAPPAGAPPANVQQTDTSPAVAPPNSPTSANARNENKPTTAEERRPGRRWPGRNNNDYYSFGQEILAPADGRIVALHDGTPDNEPYHRSSSPYTGNYIVIEHAPGELSSLGHLQNGSIEVKVGQQVRRGQRIARCGNSGNTSLPHLHYSFIGLYENSRVSMPAQFSDYILHTADKRTVVEQGIPAENSIVENVAAEPSSATSETGKTDDIPVTASAAATAAFPVAASTVGASEEDSATEPTPATGQR
jgi:murein DD-endopeptidase MepM/ murein hydrolase activator NlpD